MRTRYEEWLGGESTANKAPTKQEVANWVVHAWRQISVETIKKSANTCGVSNALDGSEDHDIVCLREYPEAMAALTEGRVRQNEMNRASDPFVILDDDYSAETDEEHEEPTGEDDEDYVIDI